MDQKTMQLLADNIERSGTTFEVLEELLEVDGLRMLELGCGKAEVTRRIAEAHPDCRITAMEVDEEQHSLNQRITDLPNVVFLYGAAEAIPSDDETYHIVLMLKSLHHVPMDSLDQALREIRRVLVPGGTACFVEPLAVGEYEEIKRLFHAESGKREEAFHALKRAVANGLFEFGDEVFFNTVRHFDDFEAFEAKVLKVTHTRHELDEDTFNEVRRRFQDKLGPGGADFITPNRVDLLRKPE